jgi:hypothetical protein
VSSYLLQWYDHGLEVDPSDTRESIRQGEIERLAKLLAIATQIQTVPRRLGGSATPEDLAKDKIRAKRVAHVVLQLLTAWGEEPGNGAVADVASEAAQMAWERWWQEHRVWLLNRQRYLATWCQKTGADPKWCKSALVRVNNELQWLAYALRD